MKAAKARNDQVFRPQKTVLDDSEVCRMIAAKALHSPIFRKQLLDHGKDRSNFRAILQVIPMFREQIVNQADLRQPNPYTSNGNRQDLSLYLRKNTNSRVLLSRTKMVEGKTYVEEKSEWGWVVSVQSAENDRKLTFDPGKRRIYRSLGYRFPAIDTPFPGRPYPVPFRAPASRASLDGVS